MDMRAVAEKCLIGAEVGTMSFPEIVEILMANGFKSYSVDFRKGQAIYFHESGTSVELSAASVSGDISAIFDQDQIVSAIREAQTNEPGYTYTGFCEKIRDAGCIGYSVSFVARNAIYFGPGEHSHIENFPPS